MEQTAPADTVGSRIRHLREEKEMSQATLAAGLFTAPYLSMLENGRQRPTSETMTEIAKRLDVTAIELIPSEEYSHFRPVCWDEANRLSNAAVYAEQPEPLLRHALELLEASQPDPDDLAANARYLRLRAAMLYRLDDVPTALEFAQQSLSMAYNSQDPKLIGPSSNTLAVIYDRMGASGTALTYVLAAARVADDNDFPNEERAKLHTNCGGAYHTLGNLEAARGEFELALQYAKKTDDKKLTAENYLHLAIAAHDMGRFADASVHGNAALADYQQLGLRHWEAMTEYNLGAVLIDLRLDSEAAPHLERALLLAQETGATVAEGMAHERLALLQLHSGDHQGAFDEVVAALDCARRCKPQDDGVLARALSTRGLVEASMGKERDADEAYSAASRAIEDFTWSQELSKDPIRRDILATRARVLQERGHIEAANELLWTALAIRR